MLDELSAVFESVRRPVGRPKGVSKRKSCPPPVMSFTNLKTRQSMSSDDGIGLSMTSMDDSIAESVKRRKRVINSKQFDSKYFFDSVVDRIENKYKNSGKEDPIIDLQNLQIVDKKGFVEQRVRTDFGYFAENTLEELRQNSFRDKHLIRCPVVESTPKSKQKQTKAKQQSVRSNGQSVRAVQRNELVLRNRKAVQTNGSAKQMATNIMIASDEESSEESAGESDITNGSEELEDNHPLVKYENRVLWTDSEYQIDCLKKTVEMLKNDRKGHFKNALKMRAMQTLKLPGLPSGPSVTPIVKFNSKGEPNFEFYFSCLQSPLESSEALINTFDSNVIYLSKVIYDCLSVEPIPQKSAQRRLNYRKNEIQYK